TDGMWVVTPSLPGRPDGPPCTDVAQAADALLALLPPGPVAVVGHSYGGAVALELALRGDRLSALVLVSSGARLRVHPQLLDAAASGPMSMGFAFGPGSAEAAAAYDAAVAQVPPATAAADWRACDRFDRLDRLGELRVPTWVLAGTEDPLTPIARQRTLAQRIPGARLIEVEGAGHMWPWERPDRFAAALREVTAALGG
ncbi:MAG: alpha/beta fold hydrolase, partial [Myxococcota bacterium]